MDVEDPINLLAVDAALDLANLFTDSEVRGSFCLTGEKCRTLMSRNRHDVIAAFKPHCLGLHTNTHSFHPTTMELLAELPYEEGCKAALQEERKGFDAFISAFDRPPVFWGGAGNTWSPEINFAIKELGILALSYTLTSLPDYAVHNFNGVMALPQALSIGEHEWSDDELAAVAIERVMGGIEKINQPWIGIFVGHPTRFRHVNYWDVPYFAGRTPDGPEMTEPAPLKTFETAKRNLQSFLVLLKSQFEIVGVDDVLKLDWKHRSPTQDELQHFMDETPEQIRGAAKWPVHRRGLNPDRIIQKTLALSSTIQVPEV